MYLFEYQLIIIIWFSLFIGMDLKSRSSNFWYAFGQVKAIDQKPSTTRPVFSSPIFPHGSKIFKMY